MSLVKPKPSKLYFVFILCFLHKYATLIIMFNNPEYQVFHAICVCVHNLREFGEDMETGIARIETKALMSHVVDTVHITLCSRFCSALLPHGNGYSFIVKIRDSACLLLW